MMTDKQTAGNSDDVEDLVASKLAAGEMKLIKLGLAIQKARTQFTDLKKDQADQDGFASLSFHKLTQMTNTHLVANDLCWIQAHDGSYLTTRLMHKDGGVITMQTECVLNGGQSGGLAIVKDQTGKLSFLKRIHLLTVLGVMGEEDPKLGQLDEMGSSINDYQRQAQAFQRQQFDSDQDQRDLDKVMTVGNAASALSENILQAPVAEVTALDVAPVRDQATETPATSLADKPISGIKLQIIRGIMTGNGITEERVVEWVGVTTKNLTAKLADDLLVHLNKHIPPAVKVEGE